MLYRIPQTSDQEGLLSQPFLALRGLERSSVPILRSFRWSTAADQPPLARMLSLLRVLHSTRWKPGSDPSLRLRSLRTAARVKRYSLIAFPKIAPSSLPNRRVHSRPDNEPLRAHVPSTVGCYTFRTFRPCGFTPLRRLAPRRSCPHCCSGSRSWGSSFVSPDCYRIRCLATSNPTRHRHFTATVPPGSPRCCSALRSFPSDFGRRHRTPPELCHHALGSQRLAAPTLCVHLAALARHRTLRCSVDPRLSAQSLVQWADFHLLPGCHLLCCSPFAVVTRCRVSAAARRALKPHRSTSRRTSNVTSESLSRPGSSPTALPPRRSIRLGSFLPIPTANLAVLLHCRVRCAPRRFQQVTPGAPVGLVSFVSEGVSTSKNQL